MWFHISEIIALVLGAGVFVVLFLKNRTLQERNDWLDEALTASEQALLESETELHSVKKEHVLALYEASTHKNMLEAYKAEMAQMDRERTNAWSSLELLLSMDLENNLGAKDVQAEVGRNGVHYVFRQDGVDPESAESVPT